MSARHLIRITAAMLVLAAPAGAVNMQSFLACRMVASGFGELEAALGTEGSKARGRLAGAQVAYFEKNLPVLLESPGPNTQAVFDDAGAGPEELIAGTEACVLEGDCDPAVADGVSAVAADLSAACDSDMREQS